jgi:hypothetical protein
MAKKVQLSNKRVAISKANAQMAGVVAAAAFISAFCLVSARVVWSQNIYQAHVTSAEEQANTQFKANVQSVKQLTASYTQFINTPTNIIGGSSAGTGNNDGSNAAIVLDALPDTYDFPALTSSLEKIMTAQAFKISSISGTDEELTQAGKGASPTPQPVAMPFSFSVTDASYTAVQGLITTLQSSIRPIQIDSLTLSGSSSDMQLTVNAHTYYQPAKNLGITKKVVQ